MKLIPRHLVLLAFSTFAMGTEAFVYTGHLTALSRDLSVPVAQTGALAASFSATLALSGPILAWLTRRADRKVLLWYFRRIVRLARHLRVLGSVGRNCVNPDPRIIAKSRGAADHPGTHRARRA